MDKAYQHQLHEKNIEEFWQKVNISNPDAVKIFKEKNKLPQTGKPFSIVMPPPNANDPLHIGHAIFVSLEDIMIRYHRMLGDDTIWVPGTDHAGIETQFVFEKKLKKNNQSRFQFDRETLYKMIWDYVQENSTIAKDQMVKMGASADWSRFTFMLEPKVVQQVLETFVELFEKKLIYRDYKLVNYCTKCGTAFSELEVVHVEQKDPMYYMKYGQFTIATVRPETKFRDTALAVNPTDPRYKQFLGQTMEIPGLLGPISMKIIADEGVDPEFGTGIMKVTPAHDMHDFELGQQYNLQVTPIITLAGKMDFTWFFEKAEAAAAEGKQLDPKYLERARNYHGKKVAEARKLIVADLEAEGLMVKIDQNYTHTVSTCYRCGTIIEPLPLPQFFVKVKPLATAVLSAIDKKEVEIIGAGHDKILRHWLENLRDWNISRQIVWGIRIPVWYSVDENPDLEVHITDEGKRVSGKIQELLKTYSLEKISTSLQELRPPMNAKYVISLTSPGENFLQETDTFDTWFSSAQWPYTILRAQENGEADFKRFYPTQVMETGYDILPFWVMRMLLMGLFKTGEVPFSTVYLHGLVRDQKGQKMSKSKGNVINPLAVIDQYGADALRMALVIRSTPGLDKSVGEPDFKAMRNFTNKMWNATRFVTETLLKEETGKVTSEAGSKDEAFREHMNVVIAQITQQLNTHRLGLAAETLHGEFWHWFCDVCIEESKQGMISPIVLTEGLLQFMKLLHPFMPYVTEAIWQELSQSTKLLTKEVDCLALSSWPQKMVD